VLTVESGHGYGHQELVEGRIGGRTRDRTLDLSRVKGFHLIEIK
jgi:hypothetical protein